MTGKGDDFLAACDDCGAVYPQPRLRPVKLFHSALETGVNAGVRHFRGLKRTISMSHLTTDEVVGSKADLQLEWRAESAIALG